MLPSPSLRMYKQVDAYDHWIWSASFGKSARMCWSVHAQKCAECISVVQNGCWVCNQEFDREQCFPPLWEVYSNMWFFIRQRQMKRRLHVILPLEASAWGVSDVPQQLLADILHTPWRLGLSMWPLRVTLFEMSICLIINNIINASSLKATLAAAVNFTQGEGLWHNQLLKFPWTENPGFIQMELNGLAELVKHAKNAALDRKVFYLDQHIRLHQYPGRQLNV